MASILVLDHFLLSATTFENFVERAYAIHDVDNLSDHDPIVVELLMDFAEQAHVSRISWPKATESNLNEYRHALSRNLSRIVLSSEALVCQYLHFTDAAHLSAIHEYSQSISNACIKAAAECMPRTCDRQDNDHVPGWSDSPYARVLFILAPYLNGMRPSQDRSSSRRDATG